MPKKASDKQVTSVGLLVGGSDKIHPRNRDMPLSMVPPSVRKHLPAPPPGKTTGHGLTATGVTGGGGGGGSGVGSHRLGSNTVSPSSMVGVGGVGPGAGAGGSVASETSAFSKQHQHQQNNHILSKTTR